MIEVRKQGGSGRKHKGGKKDKQGGGKAPPAITGAQALKALLPAADAGAGLPGWD